MTTHEYLESRAGDMQTLVGIEPQELARFLEMEERDHEREETLRRLRGEIDSLRGYISRLEDRVVRAHERLERMTHECSDARQQVRGALKVVIVAAAAWAVAWTYWIIGS